MTINTATLNTKQKQIYEQFKDDPDFDMEKALAKFQKAPSQARQIKRVKDTNESVGRELRLVIEFLHRKVELVQRKCLVCARVFAADYLYVAICSDICRAQYIFTEYGIIWDPDKPERERWDGEPPSIIKPETFEFLATFAKRILAIPEASHYVGRKVPAQIQPTENASITQHQAVKSDTDRINQIRAVKESEKANELKRRLDSGEISKIDYQMALADLF